MYYRNKKYQFNKLIPTNFPCSRWYDKLRIIKPPFRCYFRAMDPTGVQATNGYETYN